MGRHDSYTYYSESGQASSGDTPGEDERTLRQQNEGKCERCNDVKSTVVERKGDLDGEELCDECAKARQEKIEENQKRSVLSMIRSASEDE